MFYMKVQYYFQKQIKLYMNLQRALQNYEGAFGQTELPVYPSNVPESNPPNYCIFISF